MVNTHNAQLELVTNISGSSSIRQWAQEWRAHNIIHDMSDVPDIANNVIDTPMHDGPHIRWKGTKKHPPEEDGGDGIKEVSPDDVEGNINNERVDVIEETNVVF